MWATVGLPACNPKRARELNLFIRTRMNAASLIARPDARVRKPVPKAASESHSMGYFILTTVCTLTYLGYLPIPRNVLIAACVVYVLYDAFKR